MGVLVFFGLIGVFALGSILWSVKVYFEGRPHTKKSLILFEHWWNLVCLGYLVLGSMLLFCYWVDHNYSLQ